MFRRLIVLAVIQNVFHYKNNMLDELRIDIRNDDLPLLVEELLHDRLDLIEQNRVQRRGHLVPHQLLDVPLNLRPELLVVANQQPQQQPDELRDRAVLHVLAVARQHARLPAILR